MPYAVMIIDDSPIERFLAETLVKRSVPKERIGSFSAAIDALAHLRSIQAGLGVFPCVIFLDINMPLMNGFEFLAEYSEFPDHMRESCKILLFSSSENAEDHDKMRKYPFIHKFILKPLTGGAVDKMSELWTNC